MTPQRIQRKRTLGWKMPKNTVYVGRPTIWGNPVRIEKDGQCFRVARDGDVLAWRDTEQEAAEQAVNCYRDILDMMSDDARSDFLAGLRGKNLACWCKEKSPCHADVLLELANEERTP